MKNLVNFWHFKFLLVTFLMTAQIANATYDDATNFSPTGHSGYENAIVKIQGPTAACSGTLIDRRYVLTAAHCVNANMTDAYFDYRNGTFERIKVDKSWSFPNFSNNEQTYITTGDWGILRLEAPAPAVIQPLVIADSSKFLEVLRSDNLNTYPTIIGTAIGYPKTYDGEGLTRVSAMGAIFAAKTIQFFRQLLFFPGARAARSSRRMILRQVGTNVTSLGCAQAKEKIFTAEQWISSIC